MRILTIILFTITSFNILYGQNIVKNIAGETIVDKTLIVKFKSGTLTKSSSNSDIYKSPDLLVDFFNKISVTEVKQAYPNAKAPDCKSCVEIRSIYKITYSSDISVDKAIDMIKSFNVLEYAEPLYVHTAFFLPDDARFYNQYNLDSIHVFDAWELTKGDSTIIIGIVDTEFDLNHEDLIDKVAYNYDDQIDGIDNDNDGFVDNFRGWDVSNNDNDPSRLTTGGYHGSIVAGIACAETNNGKGMSGVGFNTKFLPIKVMQTETGFLNAGYDGIVYAADHGCSVINCSWGATYQNKLFAQDIVNYATFNRNALVVAAAGNDNNYGLFYPASLENVLSVGGTSWKNEKWSPSNSESSAGSNWNKFVDVSAPAANFWSSSKNNEYTKCYGGTSFSAPQISGVAALVKSVFPNLNSVEIGEQIKVTANSIYSISYNEPFKDLLGYGIVDAYRAVSQNIYPSVYLENINFVSENEHIISGDTIVIYGQFHNYLEAYSNITATLLSDNEYVTFLNQSITLDTIYSRTFISDSSNPFKFIINDNAPINFSIDFKIEYSGKDYYSYQYLTLDVSQYSFDITTNDLTTTVTSNGKVGIVGTYQGKRLIYKDYPTLIYDGGLFYGNSNVLNPRISSCFRGTNDFEMIDKPIRVESDSFDVETYTSFNDAPALDRSFGFLTEQRIFSIENDTSDFIIYHNLIINSSGNNYQNMYFGIFMDTEMYESYYNAVTYDPRTNMLYAYCKTTKIVFFGILILSDNAYSHYAIDNVLGNTVYLNDGFSELEKQICLTGRRDAAGENLPQGNDVAIAMSAFEPAINDGDTVEFSYAFILSENEELLFQTAELVKSLYDKKIVGKIDKPVVTNISEESDYIVFPTLLSEAERLNVKGIENVNSISFTDILGRTVIPEFNYTNSGIEVATDKLDLGIWIFKVSTPNITLTEKIVIE